jgi:hypothetical protein
MMLRFNLKISMGIFLSIFFIFSCSQLGLQTKKGETDPSAPDCKKNFKKEGGLFSTPVYKTWVKYDNLDFKKGFDITVKSLQSQGSQIIFTDRDLGTIRAEMAFGTPEKPFHPVDIELVKEQTSLTIHISSKPAKGGSGSLNFCSFYQEFEKSMKTSTTAPPKKSPEVDKDSSTATSSPPPPATTPRPSSTPSPPKASLPQAEVIWSSVNLREGPGTNYKVIGKAKKGTSLAILEEKNGWLRARLADRKEVWISKSATSEAPKTSVSPPASPPPSPPSSKTPDSTKPMSPM